MTATSDDRQQDHPDSFNTRALSLLLVLIAACFAANDLLAALAMWGPRVWKLQGPMVAFVVNMLVVGAIWVLSKLKPSRVRAIALPLLLALVAWMGFGALLAMGKVLVATHTLWGPWAWQTTVMLAGNLVIGVGAIWAMLWMRPWKALQILDDEPVSPATRKAKNLLGMSALVAAPGALVLYYGAFSEGHPNAMFSNRPVPLWVAIFAIACWLLSQAINKWWWYFSADEYERRADDFGNLLGWAVFLIVTPAWWVAARAGLLPHMDAMVLWVVAVGVSAVGYFWRRNH
jgi:hypothetical protein